MTNDFATKNKEEGALIDGIKVGPWKTYEMYSFKSSQDNLEIFELREEQEFDSLGQKTARWHLYETTCKKDSGYTDYKAGNKHGREVKFLDGVLIYENTYYKGSLTKTIEHVWDLQNNKKKATIETEIKNNEIVKATITPETDKTISKETYKTDKKSETLNKLLNKEKEFSR